MRDAGPNSLLPVRASGALFDFWEGSIVSSAMTVTINGEVQEIPDGLSVSDLVARLGLSTGRVAIERNREILHREAWPQTPVQSGDILEIVHFVGGG